MRYFLLYLLSFVLLDAIVPASCRSNRPYWRVEEYDCVVDSTLVSMSLTSSPNDSLLNKWCIEVSPTRAELTYLTSEDSVLFSQTRTLDAQTYEAFAVKVNDYQIHIAEFYDRNVYVSPSDQVTDFVLQRQDTTLTGFMQIDSTGDTFATLYGHVDSLRMLFMGLFPKHFDQNERFVK